jgi:transposase
MVSSSDPSRLSVAHKDALISALTARVEALVARVEALTAEVAALKAENASLQEKLGRPRKTPDNSSLPPSKGEKPNRPARSSGRRKSRPGVFRALAANPDRTIEAYADACPHCRHGLTPADQPAVHAYDHVDLPPIAPVITRVHRHRGVCPCCRRGFSAPAPVGMAPGSPFGPGIAALVLHLHVTQAISFQRLSRLMAEVFGIAISEGAIANMLARAVPAMTTAAETLAERVRASSVVASDETSARVDGKTWWQWVLLGSTAVRHVIADTRAARVATDFLKEARPEIWVADRYAGQVGHGVQRQICLAHLLRDAQYAIDEGDAVFAPVFKRLLQRAVSIGRRRDDLADATLRQYRRDLERRLDQLLAQRPTKPAAARLAKAMRRDRDDLFRFITRRDVPYTNNGCERALRPSVIFRKVTGCFRSQWGAALYADIVSVIDTAKLQGRSALQAIQDALAGKLVFSPA